MRVLHLFSNSKWTGPAEPALNLCVGLRRLGIEANFACAPGGTGSINKIVETARDRGIEPILRFHLSKHHHILRNWVDQRALNRFLGMQHYDLVHCHLDNDHRIASRCAAAHRIPLVRSSYEGEGLRGKAPYAQLLGQTARLLEPSQLAAEYDARTYGYPRQQIVVLPGAVDTERFDPARETPDMRRWLSIPPDAFAVGIVARMQTHRRYEDFFTALRRLVDEGIAVHAIVVGRGTKQEQVGWTPVRELGLERCVHFPGYLDGENYVGILRAFDVKVFLVPGSDGTCRAVREAMAMGKPVVAANRGMLAEIVEHERDGLIVDGSAESIHAALRRFATNRQETRIMGRNAMEKARTVFSLDRQARSVAEVYETVVSEGTT